MSSGDGITSGSLQPAQEGPSQCGEKPSPSGESIATPDFLSEEEDMAPGLVSPRAVDRYREKVRFMLIVTLLAYFALWGAAALALIAVGVIDNQQTTTLLDIFVVPFLPMFGAAVAFYFSKGRG